MNLADTLRGLLRRWYITFPGLVLAVAVAIGAWKVTPPSYERSATQLMLPGAKSMPVDSNPLLYLGGLSYAADVLVRAVGAENVVNEVLAAHPGTQILVERDGSSSAPFIVITVTAPTDAEAGEVLGDLVDRSVTVLDDLQTSQKIPVNNRISLEEITIDQVGTIQQRNRMVITGVAGLAVLALALLAAAMIDGLSRQRRRGARGVAPKSVGDGSSDDLETGEVGGGEAWLDGQELGDFASDASAITPPSTAVSGAAESSVREAARSDGAAPPVRR